MCFSENLAMCRLFQWPHSFILWLSLSSPSLVMENWSGTRPISRDKDLEWCVDACCLWVINCEEGICGCDLALLAELMYGNIQQGVPSGTQAELLTPVLQ